MVLPILHFLIVSACAAVIATLILNERLMARKPVEATIPRRQKLK